MPGAVMRLPLETAGFAPITTRYAVRSTSGTGTRSCSPNIAAAEIIFGSWSSDVAENRW
jgi:hypothetical protein